MVDAEGFAVDHTLDGCELVQHNYFIVLQFKADCIQSFLKRGVLKQIVSSLAKTHVQNGATDFE